MCHESSMRSHVMIRWILWIPSSHHVIFHQLCILSVTTIGVWAYFHPLVLFLSLVPRLLGTRLTFPHCFSDQSFFSLSSLLSFLSAPFPHFHCSPLLTLLSIFSLPFSNPPPSLGCVSSQPVFSGDIHCSLKSQRTKAEQPDKNTKKADLLEL